MTRSAADSEELKRRIAAHRWFHTIDLGEGVVTPGDDDSPSKLRTLGLPDRLDGLSVLDVGAWDGFFSFEAERRGAARGCASAGHRRLLLERTWMGHQGRFDLVHETLRSKVDTRIGLWDAGLGAKPKAPASRSSQGLEMPVIEGEHIENSVAPGENDDGGIGKTNPEVPIAAKDYGG